MNPGSLIPKAAILAVLLVVGSEVLFLVTTEPLTGLPYLQPTADDAILVAKQKLIPRAAGRVALIGDSSCTMGLQPDLLEAETGLPTVNLGTISTMTMVGFADLTERVCELDPPPKFVVFVALPRSFEVSEKQAHEYQLVGRYLTAYHRSSPDFTPPTREQWEWFVRKHRFNVFPNEFGGSYQKYEQELLSQEGWYPERGQYKLKPGEERDHFQPTEFAVQGLTRIVTLCKTNQIPLLVWWSPAPADSITPSYGTGVTAYSEQTQRTFPGLPFPRATVPRWDPSRFGTVTHVTPDGAAINTRELATAIKQLGWK